MVAHEDEVAEVAQWTEGIEGVHECVTRRYRRPKPRHRRVLEGIETVPWCPIEVAGCRLGSQVRVLLTCFWT